MVKRKKTGKKQAKKEKIKKVRKTSKRKGGFLNKLIFLVLLFSLGAVTFAWHKERNKNITPEQTQELKAKETKMLLEKVSKHLVLPEGQPSVATVLDAEKLKKELPFFNKAQNGFKVIVFPSKAILFDPTNDIVIDVAPVIQKKKEEVKEEEQKTDNNQNDNNEDNQQTEEGNNESDKESVAPTSEEENNSVNGTEEGMSIEEPTAGTE